VSSIAAGASGTLFLVSTPIGNLGDISHRAVEVLSSTALILAEDTRHSRRLLDHYGISTPVSSYHEHNEAKETPRLVARLMKGESIALISDAGTPLISDPGSRLVEACVEACVPIVPIPGASSVMAAVVASGFPLERFTFFGFIPRKGKERAAAINEIVASRVTTVVFEAANRVGITLSGLAAAGAGDRSAVVARELTKRFEEFRRGTVTELVDACEEAAPRGEVVLVIAGAGTDTAQISEADLARAAKQSRNDGLNARDVMQHLMKDLGAPRNLAYKIAHGGEE
jgi:16S rRNA (cytidine1402-2'-O)-methyltransferase